MSVHEWKAAAEQRLLSLTQIAPGLSKPLFGTDATLKGVVKGYLALRRNRRTYRGAANPGLAGAAAEYRRRGFLALGQPFDAALLQRIAAAFESYVADDAVWQLRYESSPDIHKEGRLRAPMAGRVVHRTLIDPLARIPEITGLLSASVVDLLEACCRCHLQLVSATYWRNYHLAPELSEDRELGYSHYWHNDGNAVDHVKLFVAMSDVTDDDGPLHVLSRRDTRRAVSWGFNRKQARHADRFNADAVRMVGPRGTAFFCNTTLCLHRAGIPDAGRSRDMLQFFFRSHAVRDLRDDRSRRAPGGLDVTST